MKQTFNMALSYKDNEARFLGRSMIVNLIIPYLVHTGVVATLNNAGWFAAAA